MSNQYSSISNEISRLKNWYQGPLVSQFNDEVPIYRGCEKGKEPWSGAQVVRSVKVRRNRGVGAASDGGSLPSLGKQTTQQALITAAYNYLRFGITGPMIKASKNDRGSFVRSLSYEMSEGAIDLMQDISRQLSWDGTGDLALVSANAVASTVITVTGRESSEDGSKFLDVDDVIDIVDSSDNYIAQSVTITALSGTTTATLTLNAPVTVSANDRIIRSGSLNQEVKGLLHQLDGGTSTVFNINRSTYPSFQGNVVNNGGAQLTLDSMQQAFNEAKRRGGGKLSAIYCDFDSQRFYQKLLTVDKRYSNTVKGDGGFSNKDEVYLSFNGLPLVADKDCPQRFFFLDGMRIKKYVLSEMEWANETGSDLIADVDRDRFQGRLRMFFNLFNEKPSATAALRNYISP